MDHYPLKQVLVKVKTTSYLLDIHTVDRVGSGFLAQREFVVLMSDPHHLVVVKSLVMARNPLSFLISLPILDLSSRSRGRRTRRVVTRQESAYELHADWDAKK